MSLMHQTFSEMQNECSQKIDKATKSIYSALDCVEYADRRKAGEYIVQALYTVQSLSINIKTAIEEGELYKCLFEELNKVDQ